MITPTCKQVLCTHAMFKLKRGLKVPNFFGEIVSTEQQHCLFLQLEPRYLSGFPYLCGCAWQRVRTGKHCCDSRAAGWKGIPSRITHTEPNTPSPLELQTNWFYSTGHLTICKIQTHLHCRRRGKMLLTKSLWLCSQPTDNKREALNI